MARFGCIKPNQFDQYYNEDWLKKNENKYLLTRWYCNNEAETYSYFVKINKEFLEMLRTLKEVDEKTLYLANYSLEDIWDFTDEVFTEDEVKTVLRTAVYMTNANSVNWPIIYTEEKVKKFKDDIQKRWYWLMSNHFFH